MIELIRNCLPSWMQPWKKPSAAKGRMLSSSCVSSVTERGARLIWTKR
ncbi:MAG TPA: hypothetical protein VF713_23950 [Thermoanaerobaculia bacterium]